MAPDELSHSDPSAAGTGTIPLPPVTSDLLADNSQPSNETIDRTGLLLVPLVLAFAFLLASFPARNSDVWMHLASGRLLVEQGLPLSSPPRLPFGSEVSPRWLYHLSTFGVYSALGGSGLVFAKALLVVGIALVLLRLSSTGRGWWVPAGCTALALLAMSTRFLLQPATVSYLLLALTLYFFRRRENNPAPALPPWPLLVVFAVWANMDSWFLLGLATVALVWLGQALDSRSPAALPRRFVSLACLAAVCLLNPAGWRGFTLPAELGWLSGQPSGRLVSPFQEAYFQTLGQTPAGLAYFPLLLLSLGSFFLKRQRLGWGQFLPWLGLALLSAFQVRTVPFFAILAGPALALNLQDWLALRQKATRRWDSRAGQPLALAFGLLLVACAWPGWLQAPPFEPRRWGLETPASLQAAAEAVRRWHQAGGPGPDARGLHLSAETANVFSWYCPEEQGLLDTGLSLAVRGEVEAQDDWAARMRSFGVNHLILHDPDRRRLESTLVRLLADQAQWPLLFVEGDVAVFGWSDRFAIRGPDPFKGWQLDADRLAFQPSEAKKAPPSPPEGTPHDRRWWEAYWRPAPPRPIDLDEATLHLLHAEAVRRTAGHRHLIAWMASQTAGLAGVAGNSGLAGSLVESPLRVVLLQPSAPLPGEGALPAIDQAALALRQRFIWQRDDAPPALLFLAIRASRRALAVNPQDARAHLVLGESYSLLSHGTAERAWGRRFPELGHFRRAQAAAALNRALALNPNYAEAHRGLAELYQEIGYLDLALSHLRAYQASNRKARAGALEAEQLTWLAGEVAARESAHTKESAGARVSVRASQALEKGLAGRSLDLLLQSDVSAFGSTGMALELELLLRTGRTKDVLEWTDPEQKATLGAGSYHWLRVQALAASGDYARADHECVLLARSMMSADQARQTRLAMAGLVGRAVLNEVPGTASAAHLLRKAVERAHLQQGLTELAGALRHEADTKVLRGLLAMEQGDFDHARAEFREAVSLWGSPANAATGAGLDFNGRAIAQGYLRRLE